MRPPRDVEYAESAPNRDFAMVWQLVPEADDRQTVPVDKAILFFGRHPECDVVITSSRKVSRKHCCVAQVDHQLVVRDLGSMNGVRVNGKAVRGQSLLRLGDLLTVGDVVFQLRDVPTKPKGPLPRRTPSSESLPEAKPPSPSRDLSQDIPVIIPDESNSFAVDESLRKRSDEPPAPSNESIILNTSNIPEESSDSYFEFPVEDD